ncbi:MAG: LysR family transcriptional regulator [Acetobacteraceae bacterium]|nr:LysR family transcriptional regulator [Acetobacteraceae bacterium]
MPRPGNIEPSLLRTFVCIAETGSFTAAAHAVGRTQSTISMQMRKLEQLLHQTLLIRGRGSSIRLTERGSALLDRAQDFLSLHDRIWFEFQAPGPADAEPPPDYALPLRAQRDAFTAQIMMTLLTNERFVEAYALVMRFVERNETVDPASLDPQSDALFVGLLSMLEYISINFLSNTIDREMLLRQRRSGLVRVYDTLRGYIDYKRVAWNRPNAYRSFEAMIRDHARR